MRATVRRAWDETLDSVPNPPSFRAARQKTWRVCVLRLCVSVSWPSPPSSRVRTHYALIKPSRSATDLHELTSSDERYPDRLRNLSDPPPLLYVRGDAERPGIDGRTPRQFHPPPATRDQDQRNRTTIGRQAHSPRPCKTRGGVAN